MQDTTTTTNNINSIIESNYNLYVNAHGKRPLAVNFTPGMYDVICARGKSAHDSEGNRRFRALVKQYQDPYAAATCKYEKSKIVTHIVNTVRAASPRGGFVKLSEGVWYEVGDRAAKEKVGQTFRDLLHTKYSSSTKAKARARIQKRIEEEVDTTESGSGGDLDNNDDNDNEEDNEYRYSPSPPPSSARERTFFQAPLQHLPLQVPQTVNPTAVWDFTRTNMNRAANILRASTYIKNHNQDNQEDDNARPVQPLSNSAVMDHLRSSIQTIGSFSASLHTSMNTSSNVNTSRNPFGFSSISSSTTSQRQPQLQPNVTPNNNNNSNNTMPSYSSIRSSNTGQLAIDLDPLPMLRSNRTSVNSSSFRDSLGNSMRMSMSMSDLADFLMDGDDDFDFDYNMMMPQQQQQQQPPMEE